VREPTSRDLHREPTPKIPVTVKWFNQTKGYRFIKPDDGSPNVFVYISAVQKAGYTDLAQGVRIIYLVPRRSGKMTAENLRLG
jgi:CspA family cold shock protein